MRCMCLQRESLKLVDVASLTKGKSSLQASLLFCRALSLRVTGDVLALEVKLGACAAPWPLTTALRIRQVSQLYNRVRDTNFHAETSCMLLPGWPDMTWMYCCKVAERGQSTYPRLPLPAGHACDCYPTPLPVWRHSIKLRFDAAAASPGGHDADLRVV
jgi:hypothetical protein